MELACPSCGTRFRVPDGALGPRGRQLRCGACAHAWRGFPEDALDRIDTPAEQIPSPEEVEQQIFGDAPPPAFGAPAEAYAPEPAPRRRHAPPPMPESGGARPGLLVGWLLLILVVVGLVAGGWYFRKEVVAQVPETQRLYDLLGVQVRAPGPPFVIDWKRAIRSEETGPTITLSGQVINASEVSQAPPQLAVVLTDSGGAQIDSWAVEIGGGPMASGEARDFETKGPWPQQAADVLVRPLQ
jgi:predicted Zn finger-like uncharacterized protein